MILRARCSCACAVTNATVDAARSVQDAATVWTTIAHIGDGGAPRVFWRPTKSTLIHTWFVGDDLETQIDIEELSADIKLLSGSRLDVRKK